MPDTITGHENPDGSREGNYIVLTPNYENTAAYFAAALRDHSFEEGATDPVVSFIEQIRYLSQTDLPAVERVIARLKRGGR